MRRSHPFVSIGFFAILAACGGQQSQTAMRADSVANLQLTRSDGRPAIVTIVREGDPQAALGVAVVHEAGPLTSLALSSLLRQRLVHARLDPLVRPSSVGYAIALRLEPNSDPKRAVEQLVAALRTPPKPAELVAVNRALARESSRFTPRGGATIECSGGLQPPRATRVTLASLERWLEHHGARHTVFSAVGGADFTEAAVEALDDSEAWPEGSPLDDSWPEDDAYGVVEADSPQLVLALRIPDANRAIDAGDRLKRPGSTLHRRLAALTPGWMVQEVSASARHRGACLTLRLVPKSSGVDLRSFALAASIGRAEATRLLAASNASRQLARQPAEMADPAQAAAVAAWNALSRSAREPLREHVSAERLAADGFSERDLKRAVASAAQDLGVPTLGAVSALERGQGQLWALLASPCGTAEETPASSGSHAVLFHALRGTRRAGVHIEPWVTPDGAGLMARTALRSGESAEAVARRLGKSLGRTLATPVEPTALWAARDGLLQRTLPSPGYRLASELLAPAQPGLLEPEGTRQALTELNLERVQRAQREFVTGPLRLAVLSNRDERQARWAREELERQLRPPRRAVADCAPPQIPAAQFGSYRLETGDPIEFSAVVATPLPDGTERAEAEWTEYLLNRPAGWLHRALVEPGIATEARATLRGGRRTGALFVQLAAPRETVDDAVAQARGLLQQLAAGAADRRDLAAAKAHFERYDAARRRDPRTRLIELWQDRASARSPNLAQLRAFHREAFANERQAVVLTRPRP